MHVRHNKNKDRKKVLSMKTTTPARRSLPGLSLRRAAPRIPMLSISTRLRALLRNLGRLHTACVCQQRDGRLLCGLAVTGFVTLG
ncbi:hypothetical protein PXNS11_540018 [Stutzerimonas xanthomarina]|nr:hypothetical protein PXNS11_540018 [Stutzerimonas xanthomarina]